MENNMRNTEEIIDIEPAIEVKKKDIVDKALDFVIGIGEEIKEHPIHTAVTAAIGIFCYRKGKKKGHKLGWKDGTYAQYKHIRDRMNYIDDDGTKWNMIDAINEGKAEGVLIFSKDQKAEYLATAAFLEEYRKSKSSN
jgi:hypothetical protein